VGAEDRAGAKAERTADATVDATAKATANTAKDATAEAPADAKAGAASDTTAKSTADTAPGTTADATADSTADAPVKPRQIPQQASLQRLQQMILLGGMSGVEGCTRKLIAKGRQWGQQEGRKRGLGQWRQTRRWKGQQGRR